MGEDILRIYPKSEDNYNEFVANILNEYEFRYNTNATCKYCNTTAFCVGAVKRGEDSTPFAACLKCARGRSNGRNRNNIIFSMIACIIEKEIDNQQKQADICIDTQESSGEPTSRVQ